MDSILVVAGSCRVLLHYRGGGQSQGCSGMADWFKIHAPGHHPELWNDELMAALEKWLREKRGSVWDIILWPACDSVSGKRRESAYKVILDRICGEDSRKLCTLIQSGLGCISSRKDKPTSSASDHVLDSVGPANDAPVTGDVGGDLGASVREVPSVSHADSRRPLWSGAELEIISLRLRSLWNCCWLYGCGNTE